MKHSFFLALLGLLFCLPGKAQDTLYYNQHWEVVNPEEAVYYGFWQQEVQQCVLRFYFATNNLLYREEPYAECRPGTPVGTHKRYYENGHQAAEVNYQDGKKEGAYAYWYENGHKEEAGQMTAGTLVGLQEYWYENGVKRLEKFHEESETRLVNAWLSDRTTTLVEGEGRIVNYYENQQPRYEGEVVNYRRVDLWKTYFPNGQVMEVVFYDSTGTARGLHQYWYANGQLEYEGHREEGQKVETWQYYDEAGNLVATSIFSPQSPNNKPYQFAERSPIPLNLNEVRKAIGYPKKALKRGIAGKVVLRVLVDKSGHYERHKVLKGDPHLVAAIESEISNLRFVPAIQNQAYHKVWVNIPFNFQLY